MTAAVLGLDPSLTSTGICYGAHLATITSPPAGNRLDARLERLRLIVYRIGDVVEGIKPYQAVRKPDLVVIESPSLGQARQGGTLDRNGLWWLIVQYLYTLQVPVVDVTPATVKKFATGKGNATKPDMRMALYKRTLLDVSDDNQVDAWWLAEIGRHLMGEPAVDLPKTHLAALDKIDQIHLALQLGTPT